MLTSVVPWRDTSVRTTWVTAPLALVSISKVLPVIFSILVLRPSTSTSWSTRDKLASNWNW